MEFIDDMAEQTEKKEKEYLLPDGFGLSLEQVKNLINQQCDVSIQKDDPIMCIVPILNAFLYEQQKVNSEYKENLEKAFQHILEFFVKELDIRIQNGNSKPAVEEPKEKKNNDSRILYGVIIFLVLTLAAVYFWK